MATGTVKWFNGQKGYGFIAPDGGGKDVFVHISAVEKAGLDGLPDGAKVTFDVVPNRGKESAENLKMIARPRQPTLGEAWSSVFIAFATLMISIARMPTLRALVRAGVA
jgi:CspA family cold shock protein